MVTLLQDKLLVIVSLSRITWPIEEITFSHDIYPNPKLIILLLPNHVQLP